MNEGFFGFRFRLFGCSFSCIGSFLESFLEVFWEKFVSESSSEHSSVGYVVSCIEGCICDGFFEFWSSFSRLCLSIISRLVHGI